MTSAAVNGVLSRRRILVVEDEFLIAAEVVGLLNGAGATIEGPFASVVSAPAAIWRSRSAPAPSST